MGDACAPAATGLSLRAMRLQAEWELLQELVRLNPHRLAEAARRDTVLFVTLLETPALLLAGEGPHLRGERHRLRVEYPRYFPTLPMEAYLDQPVFHPNIHPETGFICLWDKHRTTNTVEHAVHKAAAMLGWRLLTDAPAHCMQSEAAAVAVDESGLAAMQSSLRAELLMGIGDREGYVSGLPLGVHRRRLS